MNNYEYIIASLPVISSEERSEINTPEILDEIRQQLSRKDLAAFDLMLSGFKAENLNADFYKQALNSPVRFIREYFGYDLDVRNRKVAYLNKALERPEDQDMLYLDEEKTVREFSDSPLIDEILQRSDILSRERGLDDAMWSKIDDIVAMDVFSISVILGFTAKLQIIDRWLTLDDQRGRELLRRLVEEIRNNKKDLQ